MKPGAGRWCGTVGGYTNHRCRCDECRVANAAATAARRNRRRQSPIPPDVPHGSISTYTNYCCRCDHCRSAFTDYSRRRLRDLTVADLEGMTSARQDDEDGAA